MRLLLSLLATVSLLAVSLTAAAPAAHAVSTTRIAGADRFETSIEVSRNSPHGGVIYLASGLSFPDALAAGPVAAAEGAHLLLTRPDRVDASVVARMQELRPRLVIIVGSEATVQDAVRSQVAAALPDADVDRVGGRDRVETSLLLLDRLEGLVELSEAWVVSGHSFPDALVAASVAGATGGGIILDWHGGGAADARAWGERVATRVAGVPISIAGGTPSVSAADERLLAELGGVDLVRYAGSDRYDTARLVNDAYPVERGVSMVLATGENFPDALSGAVHSAHTGRPLYLSPTACHARIAGMLAAEAAERGITHVIGLGSAASLSDRSLSLGPCPTPVQQSLAASFGTFPNVTHEGRGTATIPLPAGVQGAIVKVDWTAATPGGQYTLKTRIPGQDDWMFAAGARDSGVYFARSDRSSGATLAISAQGSWRITLMDASNAPSLPSSASGIASAVYAFGGHAATLTTHRPQPDLRFGVTQMWVSNDSLTYGFRPNPGSPTGSIPLSGVSSLVVIRAHEPWSVSVGR
ncbi:MAG: cell wall-binding repeat-containing protein [Actinomycetota bacterium]